MPHAIPRELNEPLRRPALQILTLWALGVAQPIYDLLGNNPAFFVHQQCQPADFLWFVVLISAALPAALLIAPAQAARLLGRRAAAAVYSVGVALLFAVMLTPVIGRITPLGGWAQAGLGLLAAGTLALAWRGSARLRQFLLYLTPVVLLFPAIFLLRGGIRGQWLRPSVEIDESSAEARTVVLLVLDALPLTSLLDDSYRVDPVRYPNFARLAGTSTWYRRARATAPNTDLAVPSILSGRCSQRGIPPTFAGYPRSLFTLLGASYRTEAMELITGLCPPDLCEEASVPFHRRFRQLTSDVTVVFAHWALPRGWTGRLPAIDTAWGGFGDGGGSGSRAPRAGKIGQVEQFRSHLERIQPGDDRLLVVTHALLPHNPFYYLPSGRRYREDYDEPGGSTSAFSDDPWAAAHSYQRHLLQLGFTDLLLGELIDRLQQAGRWDEALVVVTADHGVSFRVNLPRRSPTAGNAVDILSVPLFLKAPHQQEGETVDLPVRSLDILPLIAEALGIAKPEWAEGLNRAEHEAGTEAAAWCPSLDESLAAEIPMRAIHERVDEKLALFGTGESAGAVPGGGPRPDLLGLPTESACGPTAGIQVQFDEAPFQAVDTSSDFVPAEIVGLVRGLRPGQAVDLAVAVNGTVHATTTSYLYGAVNASIWAAIVPETSFRDGRNRVEVFAANPPRAGCPISPTGAPSELIEYLGVRLGLSDVPGVEVRGLRKITTSGGRRVRWTRDRARIVVPLAEHEAARVRELRIAVANLGPETVNLRILLNRRVLFDGEVTDAPWSSRFPVQNVTAPVTIILESNTIQRRKRRPIGVALEGIWLGDGSDELNN